MKVEEPEESESLKKRKKNRSSMHHPSLSPPAAGRPLRLLPCCDSRKRPEARCLRPRRRWPARRQPRWPRRRAPLMNKSHRVDVGEECCPDSRLFAAGIRRCTARRPTTWSMRPIDKGKRRKGTAMGAERRRLFRNNACCLFVKIKKKRGKKEEANYFAFVRFFALPPGQKKIRDNIISSDPSARVLSLRSRSFLSI